MRLSRRTEWQTPVNRLTVARREKKASGELWDLTESNPTQAGFDYPLDALRSALARATAAPYSPEPLGLTSAREAVAAFLSKPHDAVSSEDIVITASTSEAYSYLFKLLCDPGDRLLTGVPSYPLLDHLAQLEQVALQLFPYHFDGRWTPDFDLVDNLLTTARANAVIVVHPNNPTGTYLRDGESAELARVCAKHETAIISDEVFIDYDLGHSSARRDSLAAARHVLTFSLGGLSKSAALPHWKLGWIRVSGPSGQRRHALEALELIADSFLSVATPVQVALPEVLALAPAIQLQILERLRRNLDVLRTAVGALTHVQLLPVEGGWSAVLRVPRLMPDEELALSILEKTSVFIQPGYFYDFPTDGYLVVSLLTRPDVFEQGTTRLAEYLRRHA